MTRISVSKRALGLLAACALGTLGALSLTGPASAHHTTIKAEAACDTTTGNWKVKWQVENSEDKTATLSDVVATPTPIPGIVNGAALPKKSQNGGKITGEQTVPGNATSAKLAFKVTWSNGAKNSDSKIIEFKGKCEKEKECIEVDKASYKHTFNAAAGTATVELKQPVIVVPSAAAAQNDEESLRKRKPLCDSQPFTLVSYIVTGYGPGTYGAKYDIETKSITPTTSKITLKVDVPPCRGLVTLLWGAGAPDELHPPVPAEFTNRVLGGAANPGKRSTGPVGVGNVNERTPCKAWPSAKFVPTCDGFTVTLTNSPKATADATFKVNGTEYVVKPGASKEVKVAVKEGETTVTVTSGRSKWKKTWELPAGCVKISKKFTCDEIQITVENNSAVPVKAVGKSGDKSEEAVIAAKGKGVFKAPAKNGTATVTAADASLIATYAKPKDCGGIAGALPKTGASLGGAIAAAVVLLGAGVAMLVLVRRRRTITVE